MHLRHDAEKNTVKFFLVGDDNSTVLTNNAKIRPEYVLWKVHEDA